MIYAYDCKHCGAHLTSTPEPSRGDTFGVTDDDEDWEKDHEEAYQAALETWNMEWGKEVDYHAGGYCIADNERFDLAAIKAACEGHTPGPLIANGAVIEIPTGEIVAIIPEHHRWDRRILEATTALFAAAPALLAECEYQAQAIEELVATVDDMIVQRNKAEAENERLTAERDRLQGLVDDPINIPTVSKLSARCVEAEAERDMLRGALEETLQHLPYDEAELMRAALAATGGGE